MTRVWTRTGIYGALIAACIFYLLPAYVLVVTGLKPFKDVSLQAMWELPRTVDFGSFGAAWERVAPNFWNSFQIAVPAALITALVGSINGYIFAKWHFKYADILFTLVLFGIFLPYQGIVIPLVLTLQRLGLYGSIPGLVLAHCVFAIPITALIFRSAFARIPGELLDAAKMDGAGFFRIYGWIVAPLALPAFAVVLIWQFTSVWNDFLLGVVVLSDPRKAPVTVAINNLAGTYFVEWNIQMAGAVIAALPTVVIYLVLGRLFMRGLLAGSLKA